MDADPGACDREEAWTMLRQPGGCQKRLNIIIKGSLGGETSVLRTFRMSGKELVKERVSEGKSELGKELIVTFRLSGKELVKGRVRERVS